MYDENKMISEPAKKQALELAHILTTVPSNVSDNIMNMVRGVSAYYHFSKSLKPSSDSQQNA